MLGISITSWPRERSVAIALTMFSMVRRRMRLSFSNVVMPVCVAYKKVTFKPGG